MRVAYLNSLGPPDVIQVGELADLRPGVGEVVVRVSASAVNPIDLYIRSGAVAMPLSFPSVIGCDLAGPVESAGPGATRFRSAIACGAPIKGSSADPRGVRRACRFRRGVALPNTRAALAHRGRRDGALEITAHLGLFE
jgi:NADPH2:quinone reductase